MSSSMPENSNDIVPYLQLHALFLDHLAYGGHDVMGRYAFQRPKRVGKLVSL